jgi:hypothetical protein
VIIFTMPVDVNRYEALFLSLFGSIGSVWYWSARFRCSYTLTLLGELDTMQKQQTLPK